MNLPKLVRLALGVPVVFVLSASLAWEFAKLSREEREEFYATVWDAFFVGDGGAS